MNNNQDLKENNQNLKEEILKDIINDERFEKRVREIIGNTNLTWKIIISIIKTKLMFQIIVIFVVIIICLLTLK